MPENAKTPEIRFAGFTDAWEQRKLGDIALIIMGQSPNSSNYTDNPDDHILVQGNADMKNGRVTPRVWTTQITKKGEKGDLILSIRAPVGDVGKTDFPVVLGRGVAAIRGNEFLYQSFLRMKQIGCWDKLCTGSTFDSINSNDIRESRITVPAVDEQARIGQLFASLDRLVALHRREHEKTINIKKALLEKMFPKDGAAKPEIRFAGFTDAWEQRKLGELMEITSLKRIHQSDWTDSGVRFLRARDIVSASKGEEPTDYLYVSQEKYDEYSRLSGKVKIGDLLVTGVGSIGVPMLVKTEEPLYFKDGNVIWFRNESIDGRFFYNSFTATNIQKFIRDVAGIGTVGTYTIDSGKKTPICIPTMAEQAKIGAFFASLDNLISLHRRELEKLQNMKSALLEKMFV